MTDESKVEPESDGAVEVTDADQIEPEPELDHPTQTQDGKSL